MPKPATGLYTRTDSLVCQWRVRVPKDLAVLYSSKEWANRRSLGTSVRADATLLAAGLYAEWPTKFAQQRKQLTPESVHSLTPELITFLSETLRHDAQTAYHNNTTEGEWAKDGRLQGMPDSLQGAITEDNVEEYRRYTDAIKTGSMGEVFPGLHPLP